MAGLVRAVGKQRVRSAGWDSQQAVVVLAARHEEVEVTMKYYFVIARKAVGQGMWRRSIVAMLTVKHVAWMVAGKYSDIFESEYVVVNQDGGISPL